MSESPSVAIVHDFLTQFGGAERVAAELCAMYPGAPLYASMYIPEDTWPEFESVDVRCSYLQRLGPLRRQHRLLLPFYADAMERLRIDPVDVVISSSSSFAKGIHPPDGARHVCYCHNPMRLAWRSEDYLARERMPRVMKAAIKRYSRSIQEWDLRRNKDVDLFVANSENVRRRIETLYAREAEVVYPPVRIPEHDARCRPENGYLLVISRLVAYKRVDLAVQAAQALGVRLVVVGQGSDRQRLEAMAGPLVEFRGHVPDADLDDLWNGAAALVFPGEEDFGIVPVEAMARGVPVAAFGSGGALETVVEGSTGEFFYEENADELRTTIERVLSRIWDPKVLRARAEQFSTKVFNDRMRHVVAAAIQRESGDARGAT